MTTCVLAVHAATTGVTAAAVDATGAVRARGHRDLAQHRPAPGQVEHAPEEIWQAVLGAVREVLDRVQAGELASVAITNQRDTVLLWDRETLGSPRRAVAGQDRRTGEVCERLRAAGHEARVAELTGRGLSPGAPGPTLAWLAEHEPRTWALVEEGRYAVGTLDSYLVARMARGLEHVTDVSNASRTLLHDLDGGDWSAELCGVFGVPLDALPEVVPSRGEVARTDPRVFLGLALPVAGLVADRSATHLGLAGLGAGDASWDDTASSLLVTTGRRLVHSAGALTTAGWRSPDGTDTFALEVTTGADRSSESWPGLRDAAPDLVSLRVEHDADDQISQDLGGQLGLDVHRASAPDAALRGAALLARTPCPGLNFALTRPASPADPARTSR